jgi:hypothetical protein
VLERFCEQNKLPIAYGTAKDILNEYILMLKNFKLGNVLSIEYETADKFRLIKIAERPPPLHKPKLPG